MDLVLVPGAWMGGWAWDPVSRGLKDLGHRVHPVTLSGLRGDERAGQIERIGPETHVDDVVSLLTANDLRDVVLVGHQYAGVVVGQVADRVPERVAHTVYLEGFLPQDGRAMLDELSAGGRRHELARIAAHDGRWPPPTPDDLRHEPDLSSDQIRWLTDRFVAHPGRTVTEPVRLDHPLADQQATYIACTGTTGITGTTGTTGTAEPRPMREAKGWTARALDAGNWSLVTAPEKLAALLDTIANGG